MRCILDAIAEEHKCPSEPIDVYVECEMATTPFFKCFFVVAKIKSSTDYVRMSLHG
jgi:hypothetical protein